jgi:hypothetical protein
MEYFKSNRSDHSKTPDAIIEYRPNNTVYLNLPCILTSTKTLKIGSAYMYKEGQHIFPVKILNMHDADGYVFLSIQNLWTGSTMEISWILNNDFSYTLWSIASLDYIIDLTSE